MSGVFIQSILLIYLISYSMSPLSCTISKSYSPYCNNATIKPSTNLKHVDKQMETIAIMLQEWSIGNDSDYPNLVTADFNWSNTNSYIAPSAITIKHHEQVGSDGDHILPFTPHKSSTINVSPESMHDVEFVAWASDIWHLHVRKLYHITNVHSKTSMGIIKHDNMFTFLHAIANRSKQETQARLTPSCKKELA